MQTVTNGCVVNITVPFLSENDIERAATSLLIEFGDLRKGGSIKPPVPVEKILEKHLKLTLDFDDLHKRLGIPRSGEEPEVLGALWADGEVFIDESLDPDKYPELESRYRFTLAHEIGHWCLHKDYLPRSRGVTAIAGPQRSFVQVRPRIELSGRRIVLPRVY